MESIKKERFKISNVNENFIVFFLSSLVFLILFAPTVLQYIKGILIFVLAILSFLIIAKRKTIPIHYKVFIWIFIYTTSNFFYLFKGTYDDLGVFIQLLPVNVIWPIIYTIVLLIPISRINKVDFTKIFVISTFVIEIFILNLYFDFIGILPSFFLLDLPLGQRVNYNFGYVNLFTPSITSLFFLLPYVVSKLLANNNKMKTTLFYLVLLVFGVVISLITGRRALILVVGISPFISLFWSKISSNNNIKHTKIIVIAIIIVLISLIFLSTVDIGLRLQYFDTQHIQGGTSLREDQFISLIEGWKEAPLFGVGTGVNANVVRSVTVPGTYELSYVAKLFHKGFFGVIVYIYMIIWLLRKLTICAKTNQERSSFLIAFLTGLTSLLLAESTNPYMGSFDGMWVLFFSLAIINNHYLKNIKKESVPHEN